ncbi:MAG TPA: S1C family serine protease [Burkholderiales bacterium]|jgi:S1-C subfamily serine protease|nr:S1C family serine protease [Burkholderiales bacterium]
MTDATPGSTPTVTVSFFAAALSAWRAAHVAVPDLRADSLSLDAVVKLSIKAVPEARTADNLGTEREGTGVVIDEKGLILTIGYLILEAHSILVVTADGRVFPAGVVGYDHATGFGLLRASYECRPVDLGDSAGLTELSTVLIAAHGAAGGTSRACVVARRRFTGWWEYMIEDGIFTAPPRFEHSGAALLDADGKLVGIGSLWVSDTLEIGAAFPGNMFVPIDLLKPLLAELLATGRRREAPRPWLGVYSEEIEGHVVVTRVLPDSPAAKAGISRGDVILGVGGQAVGHQSDFYRRLWASGEAGASVVLHVLQKKMVRQLTVHSADRMAYLRPWRA